MKRILPQLVVSRFKQEHSSPAQLASPRPASLTLLMACFALGVVAALVSADSALAVSTGSVAGVVRDAAGTPQLGIAVELLRADSTVAARVFTDRKGIYNIGTVLPGQYALRAAGSAFIPTLKQNLRIRTNTIVNLTVNNLYDVMQWVPRPQRPRAGGTDDWAWTLRTAESRPLLRWLDDGSPILIWDGRAETDSAETRRSSLSRLRMRVLASAGGRHFGESQQQLSMHLQQDTSVRRRIAISAQEDPSAAGVMEAMMGFRQEMGSSPLGTSSVQTLIAVMSDPEAGSGVQQGIQAASLRTWESMQILNGLEAEAGSDQVLARLGDGSSVAEALPFGSLTVHHGQSALEYRVATSRPADAGASESMPGAWLPMLSERDGQIRLEHGMHQEIGWSTTAGPAQMRLVVYGDNIVNPVVEASGHLSQGENAGQFFLVDGASGLLRVAGPNYTSTGVLASVESRLPGNNSIKLSYASGDALVMHATGKAEDVAHILQGAGSRRAQMYSVALSGTVEGAGTRWRSSYRWQPEATVTEVAPFALDASQPYLNVYVAQPIWENRQGGGIEAQLDLRNLLAEGYQPILTSDGSHLYFAQAQRSARGGLAFIF